MFSRLVWPGAARSFEGVCSRAWHFKLQDDDHPETAQKVIFRHGVATGNWVVIANGQTIQHGFVPIVNRKFEISFLIDCRYEAVIKANGKSGMGYSHSLVVKDKEIMEIKRSPTEMLSVGEQLPDTISIPDTRVVRCGEGKDVVLYQICIQCAGQTTSVVVERRFSEFITLANLLRSQKDQLSTPLPSLPAKVFSPWVDQRSESFIAERRQALQRYLGDLLNNARVRHYTEFLLFLGLNPISGQPLHRPTSGMNLMFSDDEEEGFLP